MGKNNYVFGVCSVIFWSIICYRFICGAVMMIFNFEYRSMGNIILFFIIATFVSYPLSLLAGTLPKVLLFWGRLTKQSAVLLYIVLDTIAASFGLSIVDYFMVTVSATEFAIIFISFILSLFGINDIDKKTKGGSILCSQIYGMKKIRIFTIPFISRRVIEET